jgi:tetratricopeptide (TPR) repeat protein
LFVIINFFSGVPWLLIFDNADDLKTLKDYWPVSNRGQKFCGHIIMSSRDPASARYPIPTKDLKGVQLMPLQQDDGAGLLLSIVKVPADDASRSSSDDGTKNTDEFLKARALVAKLGGLPLAISQIANYMLDTGCGLQDLLEIFVDYANRGTILEQDSGGLHMSYQHSLTTVWEMSMARIERADSQAIHLLQLLSVLDPDGIPITLLDGSGKQHEGVYIDGLAYLSNKARYLNAIKALTQQSMIYKSKSGGMLYMHRLLGEITRNKMTSEDRKGRFEEALELLYRVYPQLSIEKAMLNDQWPQCRLYTPQVRVLERHYRELEHPSEPNPRFVTVLANASWFLYEQGLLEQAMNLLPTAQQVGDQITEGDEFSMSTVHRALGGICGDMNDPQGALSHFLRQLHYLEKLGDADALPVAHGYSNVALAELALQNYEAAMKNITKSQEIRSKYPGRAREAQALTYDVYGVTLSLRGAYDEAIDNIQKAMDLYDDEQGVGNYLSAL